MVNEVLEFWFSEVGKEGWYRQSDVLDEAIRRRFESLLKQVAAGETAHWRDTPEGRLAEIIVLDQFSRNMYRGTPDAFATDSLALVLAQEAVRNKTDQSLEDPQRSFLYMPYMHSESTKIHKIAVSLFKSTNNLRSELRHKEIIDRFGRYPHRNKILKRVSTSQEVKWLENNKGF